VSDQPISGVSGGIWLDYRLSHALLALTTALLREESASTSRVRVCESGFGAGHSTVVWYAAAMGIHSIEVFSFDFFKRVYQPIIADWLTKALYNTSMVKLVTIKGNTCETVPGLFNLKATTKLQWRCDLIHGSSLCNSDNIDLVLFASSCGTILTSAAMDDLANIVYFVNETTKWSPLTYIPKMQGQWLWLYHNGCIADVSCYEERPFTVHREYLFAASGTVHRQKFCIALVTDECESSGLNSSYYQAYQTDHREKWIKGYGRRTTKNLMARKACMNSPKYAKRSLLLSSVAEHYNSFLVPSTDLFK